MWDSGILEMWGTRTLSSVAVTSKSGTTMYNSVQKVISFPKTSLTVCDLTINGYNGSAGAFVVPCTGGGRKSSTNVWVYCATSVTTTMEVSFHAFGTWK